MARSIDMQALIGFWKAREQVIPEVTLVNVEVRPGSRIESAGDHASPETEEPRTTAPLLGSQPPADPAPPADAPVEGSPADAPPPGTNTDSPLDEGFNDGIDDEGFHEVPRVTVGGEDSGHHADQPTVVVHDAASPAASSSSVAAHSANQADADVRVDCGGAGSTGPESGVRPVPALKSGVESPPAVSGNGQTEDRREDDITVEPSAPCGDEVPSADVDAAVVLKCLDTVCSREPPVDTPGHLPPRKNRFVALSARVFRKNGERAPETREVPGAVSAEPAAAGPEEATGGSASGWPRRRKGRKPGTARSGKPMKLRRKRSARKQADPAEECPPPSGDATGADRHIPTIFLTSPEGAVTDCVPCTTPLAVDSNAAFDLENKGAATEPYLPPEDYVESTDGGQSVGRPGTIGAERGATRPVLGTPFATGFRAIWRLRKSSKRAQNSAV